jgi:hypothetical protein
LCTLIKLCVGKTARSVAIWLSSVKHRIGHRSGVYDISHIHAIALDLICSYNR